MERRMLNSKAVQILDTAKPSISLSANRMIKALMINRNNPSVTMVIGKVRMINIGFTKRFNRPRTTATISADIKALPDNSTPGKK